MTNEKEIVLFETKDERVLSLVEVRCDHFCWLSCKIAPRCGITSLGKLA